MVARSLTRKVLRCYFLYYVFFCGEGGEKETKSRPGMHKNCPSKTGRWRRATETGDRRGRTGRKGGGGATERAEAHSVPDGGKKRPHWPQPAPPAAGGERQTKPRGLPLRDAKMAPPNAAGAYDPNGPSVPQTLRVLSCPAEQYGPPCEGGPHWGLTAPVAVRRAIFD